jgi:hypothetical protein
MLYEDGTQYEERMIEKDKQQEEKEQTEKKVEEKKTATGSIWARVNPFLALLFAFGIFIRYESLVAAKKPLGELLIWIGFAIAVLWLLAQTTKKRTGTILTTKEARAAIRQEISEYQLDGTIYPSTRVEYGFIKGLGHTEGEPEYYIQQIWMIAEEGINDVMAVCHAKGETQGIVYFQDSSWPITGVEALHKVPLIRGDMKRAQKYGFNIDRLFGAGR